jgi:hypothetical protein
MAGKPAVTAASIRPFVKVMLWTVVPLIGALLFLSVVASYSPDLSIIFILAFALAGIGLIVWLLLGLIGALRRRQWGNIAPVLAGLVLAALLAFPAWLAGDYVHLADNYARNAEAFAKAGHQPVSTPWNSNGWAGINCDRYLVYDRSGRGGKDSGPGVIERHLTSRFHIRTDCS